MKMKKIFVLLAAITLVACSSNSNRVSSSSIEGDTNTSSEESQTTSESSINQESSSSVNTTSSTTADSSSNAASSSSSAASSSSQNNSSSSATSSSSNPSSSSSQPSDDNTLTFNFFNPSCGTAGSNTLNDTLKSYMNQVAAFSFVSSVSNANSQIMDTAPEKGYQKLTIGSAKNAGELEFTFVNTIKTITVTALTYYKYYDNANHPDSPSVCYINADENIIDVTAGSDNEPVEKELKVTVNAKKVKLYNKSASNRTYIKTMTFTY